MLRSKQARLSAMALPLAFVIGATALPIVSAQAQSTHTHRSFWHRHPKLATAGGGVAGWEVAKHSHGFLHRHPYATAIGGAMIAHHYAKKHYHRP